ncbi:MAG: hypothetical protein E7Z71_03095 [Methanocorpusculum parvum]|nr:hypothetical protein [Methanocorpusculum parvum]
MAKTALYTVGARMSRETVQRIDKNKKEKETRSELINKAVIYYLDAIENPQNTNEKDVITIINNPETLSRIAELVFQKIQNETFILTKK